MAQEILLIAHLLKEILLIAPLAEGFPSCPTFFSFRFGRWIDAKFDDQTIAYLEKANKCRDEAGIEP